MSSHARIARITRIPRLHVGRAALAALVVLLPAALRAQESASSATFAVGGGISIPTGDIADVADKGYHVQLSLGGRAPALGGPTLRVDALYAALGDKHGYAGTNVWSANLNIVASAGSDESGIRPYLIGGAGYYNVKGDYEGAEAKSAFGVNGGGGLEFDLGQGLGAFVEARFHYIVDAYQEPLLLGGDNRAATFVPITFGLRF